MTNDNLAKVSIFKDKIFTASSGNSCKFKIIGPGGIHIIFNKPPTQTDMDEAESFIAYHLQNEHGTEISFTRKSGDVKSIHDKNNIEQSFKEYRDFLKEK